MTADQTRQLGIEFERRIQTIDPTTELVGKMETDDIYSYLNQYQLQYVKQMYILDGQADSQSRQSDKIQDTLKPLIKHQIKEVSDDSKSLHHQENDQFVSFIDLPEDYYSYIRSVSHIRGGYNDPQKKEHKVPNIILKQDDFHKVLDSFYDEGRILRNPVCTLYDQDHLEVLHDMYTDIVNVDIVYIKRPNQFGVYGPDNVTPCELPYDCFEDLVSGAVELYFNYKYKVALASQAARRNATRAELGTDKPQKTQESE